MTAPFTQGKPQACGTIASKALPGGQSSTPSFAGVYWEVQDVLLEDVDWIEVVRGPGATIWGSNAVNGVINIITKSAMQTRDTIVSAASGNVEQAQLSRRCGAGTDRVAYRTVRQNLNYREIRHAFDIDFIHDYRLRSRHNIIWGSGARISPSRYFQTVETVDFIPHHQTYNLFSGFLQDEIAILPERLAFTVGTKFEHNSSNGFQVQPSVRIAWTPDTRNALWAALTRAARTPSRLEHGFRYTALIQAALPLCVRQIGDAQFSSEELMGYECGYRKYITRRAFVTLTSFHNRYDDLLSVEGETPAHRAAAQSFFTLPRAFELDITWRYVRAVPGFALPAYSTAHARIARPVGRNFELSFVGRNLLQPSHAEYGGVPGPLAEIRRSAYLKVTWIQ